MREPEPSNAVGIALDSAGRRNFAEPMTDGSRTNFKEAPTQVGEWEKEPLRCVDCGSEIKEPKLSKSGRQLRQRHFYSVAGRIICPACFVTTRIPTYSKRSA